MSFGRKKLLQRLSSPAVGGGATPPGGAPGGVQYNNAGAFGSFGTYTPATGLFEHTGRNQIKNTYVGWEHIDNNDTKSRIRSLNWGRLTNNSLSGQTARDIFLNDAGVEIEDCAAIVEFYINARKTDGSDIVSRKLIVAFKKDGAANPVIVGAVSTAHSVGNATPVVTITVDGAGLIQVAFDSSGSGEWQVSIWGIVSYSI